MLKKRLASPLLTLALVLVLLPLTATSARAAVRVAEARRSGAAARKSTA